MDPQDMEEDDAFHLETTTDSYCSRAFVLGGRPQSEQFAFFERNVPNPHEQPDAISRNLTRTPSHLLFGNLHRGTRCKDR